MAPIVTRVVAGESHTLVLTDNGKVFAWGKGFFGRLGNGSSSDEWVPAEVRFTEPSADRQHALVSDGAHDSHPRIISVAAGAYHSLALTDEGEIWSWGYNLYGQLGHEDFDDAIPHPLCSGDFCKDAKKPEDEHVEGGQEGDANSSKVVMVEAGGMMSCAVDECGGLWMWGHCPFQEKEGTDEPFMLSICETPRPVAGLQGLHVRKVACGNEHVLALADSQYEPAQKFVCYAWGSNTYGQLGLGDKESRIYPQRVRALDDHNVGILHDVACGAYHSAILTHHEENRDFALSKRSSMCWTFGMGENGQLGHGNTQNSTLPQLVVSLPENEQILAMACGLFHMGIVTEAGGVWIWGMERGLGLCPGIGSSEMEGGDYMLPIRLSGSALLDGSRGFGLACGAAHTVMVVKDGEHGLWAWGRGQNGVLGTGQCVDSLTPCPVVWPPHKYTENASIESNGDLGISDIANHNASVESGTVQLEQMLSLAQKEICALTTDLVVTKKQHALLHAALFGPSEYGNMGDGREVLQEWDRKVELSSYEDLVHLDHFYHQARSRVKELLLQKKMENYCKQIIRTLKNEGKSLAD